MEETTVDKKKEYMRKYYANKYRTDPKLREAKRQYYQKNIQAKRDYSRKYYYNKKNVKSEEVVLNNVVKDEKEVNFY